MSLIVLSVMVVIVQSLTTTILKDDEITLLALVSGSICGIEEVVVTV